MTFRRVWLASAFLTLWSLCLSRYIFDDHH